MSPLPQAPGTPRQFQRRELLASFGLGMLALGASAGCSDRPGPAFMRIPEARHLAADTRIAFNKAADASLLAVMANTDEASVAFAHEAEAHKQAVQAHVEALAQSLADLGIRKEIDLLETFKKHFAEYQALDQTVLELAVENTNLKAQHLSFGPEREAADAFESALGAMAQAAPPRDRPRVESLTHQALLAVYKIQVLHAPHIAEAADDAMTQMEQKMDALEIASRDALLSLAEAGCAIQPATEAFDRFMAIHTQIIVLSRRNSNVRSLALVLGQMRTLTIACDTSLDALADALEQEGSKATR